MKKALIGLVLLGILSTALAGCGSRAPALDEIYDRVVTLVEDSYALNTVFYGNGLPVYTADSDYAEFTHLYYGFDYTEDYEIVTPYAQYGSADEIKAAAERVYSREYLDDVLYPAAFTGYAVSDGQNGATFAFARYLTEGAFFCQSRHFTPYFTENRVYDFSSMRITPPSTAEAVYVTLDSFLPSDPETLTAVRLRLVLQDGIWLLDSFTG